MTPVERAAEHPLIRAALEEAGWTPARHHDLDDWVTSLRAEGFTIVAPALDVLRELGGLTITPPRRDDAAFGSGVVVIDPLWAATGEAERIRVRERELGSDLCPVGEWMGEYILLVADDGSLMAETTFQVLRVGRDIADALHRMIVADTPPEEVQVIAADVRSPMSSTSSPTHPAILPPLDLRDTAELIAELGDNQRVLGRLFELVAARTLMNVLYPIDGACREYLDDM